MRVSVPSITVVVPSYRHAAFIGARIESIVSQSYRDFELLVIDDCSPDESDAVIRSLQARYGFTYCRNPANSGTPFSAWERAAQEARGEFVWICESDDVAEPDFLQIAVAALRDAPDAALFYCDSNVIDAEGGRVGHTDEYFHDIWKETRWNCSFSAEGLSELASFQIRGQTVPNMSSTLIRTAAFRQAYRPFLKRFKLTGDWLFVGWLMAQGQVVYQKQTLSNFRRHEQTSRASVQSARSQAEFVLTKYLLFVAARRPTPELAQVLSTDVIRFLYEPARWHEVLRAMLSIAPLLTVRMAVRLGLAIISNPVYVDRFKARYRMIKRGGLSVSGD
jgi:glycosyltransferase involved in cell wall biosynthesis